jgi:hypothetical protein
MGHRLGDSFCLNVSGAACALQQSGGASTKPNSWSSVISTATIASSHPASKPSGCPRGHKPDSVPCSGWTQSFRALGQAYLSGRAHPGRAQNRAGSVHLVNGSGDLIDLRLAMGLGIAGVCDELVDRRLRARRERWCCSLYFWNFGVGALGSASSATLAFTAYGPEHDQVAFVFS